MSAAAPTRERFLDAMAELPAGVTVVTTAGPGGAPLGATVSAVSSLSLEPALVVVCLACSSETCRALEPASPFLVHVLREGQEEVARAWRARARRSSPRSPGRRARRARRSCRAARSRWPARSTRWCPAATT